MFDSIPNPQGLADALNITLTVMIIISILLIGAEFASNGKRREDPYDFDDTEAYDSVSSGSKEVLS